MSFLIPRSCSEHIHGPSQLREFSLGNNHQFSRCSKALWSWCCADLLFLPWRSCEVFWRSLGIWFILLYGILGSFLCTGCKLQWSRYKRWGIQSSFDSSHFRKEQIRLTSLLSSALRAWKVGPLLKLLLPWHFNPEMLPQCQPPQREGMLYRLILQLRCARYISVLLGNSFTQVYESFPNSVNVVAVFVESMMNLRPWKLWKDGNPEPDTLEITQILEEALKNFEPHPGSLLCSPRLIIRDCSSGCSRLGTLSFSRKRCPFCLSSQVPCGTRCWASPSYGVSHRCHRM